MPLKASANHLRFLCLGIIVAVIVSKFPVLFIEPRFWAEEGAFHFHHAYTSPWYVALFIPHYGYYALTPNLSTLIATLVPLEYAPFVTTTIAFFIQLLPFLIVWFGKSLYWNTPGQKIIASLILLFAAHEGSMWLNTINSQFYLPISAFLILLEDMSTASQTKKRAYGAIIFLAAFTGIISCLLTPLFLWRAYKEKLPVHMVFAFIMLAACFVHISVFAYAFLSDSAELTIRVGQFYPKVFFSKFAGGLFNGLLIGPAISVSVWDSPFKFEPAPRLEPIMVALLGGLLFFIYYTMALPRILRIYYIGACVFLAAFSILFSIQGTGGPRYIYAPSVIMAFLLMENIYAVGKHGLGATIRRISAVVLLIIAFISGAWQFYGNPCCHSPEWIPWQDEVAKWREDKRHWLAIQPPSWKVDLSKQ